jgi:hypothetical protein
LYKLLGSRSRMRIKYLVRPSAGELVSVAFDQTGSRRTEYIARHQIIYQRINSASLQPHNDIYILDTQGRRLCTDASFDIVVNKGISSIRSGLVSLCITIQIPGSLAPLDMAKFN